MFGSSVRLRDGLALVPRSRVFETWEESGASYGAIARGLDALGFGRWDLEHSSGGCHTYALYVGDEYVWVSDAYGPIGETGDADEFLSGGVMVGFYSPAGDCEGVYFTEGMAVGVDRETAIVDAVRRVLDAVGFSFTSDGFDWERIASAVSAGVCNVCDGSSVTTWRGVDSPCWGCECIAQASTWGV